MPLDPIGIHESPEDAGRQRKRRRLPVHSEVGRQRIKSALELLKAHAAPDDFLGSHHLGDTLTIGPDADGRCGS
jgi:hypothetical protein